MSTFNNALIFLKPHSEEALTMAQTLRLVLESLSIRCLLIKQEGTPDQVENFEMFELGETPPKQSLAFVLGGDGTFLGAARMLFGKSVPVVGINLGNRGFLTEVDRSDMKEHITSLLGTSPKTEFRPYFTVTLKRANTEIMTQEAFINDAVLQRNADEKMLTFKVNVGGRLVTYNRADGLIVATPTGSTAYNLSSGGPIVHPRIDGLILSPICPHNLSFKPVVIPPEPIEIKLESDRGILNLDGRIMENMQAGDKIYITKSEHKLELVHSNRHSFFELLRYKLGWDISL